ncbi:MAG: 3'-5' exonuclease [Bilophila wadsworthia]
MDRAFPCRRGLLTPYDVTREALGRLDIWSRYPDEAAFVRRLKSFTSRKDKDTAVILVPRLLNKHGQQEKAPMPETLDAVRVMTMHKSKGLQFPSSSCRGTTFPNGWTALPWRRMGRADGACSARPGLRLRTLQAIADNAREALHLLYVAWTRAEELHAF